MTLSAPPSWAADTAVSTTVLRLSLGIGLVLVALPLTSRAVGVWLEQRRWTAYLRQWVSSQPTTTTTSTPSFTACLVLLSSCLSRSSAARARACMGAALFVGAHAALCLVVADLEGEGERLRREQVLRWVYWTLCIAHFLAIASSWVSSQAYRQRLREVRVADRVLRHCLGKPLTPRPPGELISRSFELETSLVLNAALFSVLTDALGIESHWSRLGSFAGFEFSVRAWREELSQLEVDVCSLEVAMVEHSSHIANTVPGLRIKAEENRVMRNVCSPLDRMLRISLQLIL